MEEKIYHGLDLNGNKLKNTKVDEPLNPYDLTNKKYVDKNFLYDTEISENTDGSPVFDWVTNLYGKPIKQVIDNLVYPIISYPYQNPKIDNITLSNINRKYIGNCQISDVFKKISGSINIEFTKSDRNSNKTTYLRIYDNNNLKQEFSSNTTSDIKTLINFNELIIFPDIKITIEKEYVSITEGKPGSDGSLLIPDEFKKPFKLSYDITEKIIGKIIFGCLWKRIIFDGSFDLSNLTGLNTYDDLIYQDFKYSNELFADTEYDDKSKLKREYCFGIDTEIYESSDFELKLNDGTVLDICPSWYKNSVVTKDITNSTLKKSVTFFILKLGYFKDFIGAEICFKPRIPLSNNNSRYDNNTIELKLSELKESITGGSTINIKQLHNIFKDSIVNETTYDNDGIVNTLVGLKTKDINGRLSIFGTTFNGNPFIRNIDNNYVREFGILIDDGTYPPVEQPTPDPDYPAQDTLYSYSKNLPASANIVRVLNEKVEAYSIKEDLDLVKPEMIGTWSTIPETNIYSDKNIIVERGYNVKWTGGYRYTEVEGKKLPNNYHSSSDIKFLPEPNTISPSQIFDNITNTRTIKAAIKAPKSGYIISESGKLIPAFGDEIQTDMVSVTVKDRIYYGPTPDNSNIKNLSSELVTSKTITKTGITTNTSQYYVYAYPKSLGLLTSIIMDDTINVFGAFNVTEKIIQNIAGLSITYYVYTSNNKGAFTNSKLKFS